MSCRKRIIISEGKFEGRRKRSNSSEAFAKRHPFDGLDLLLLLLDSTIQCDDDDRFIDWKVLQAATHVLLFLTDVLEMLTQRCQIMRLRKTRSRKGE